MSKEAVYVYDRSLLAALRRDHPHLDIRAPDGTEPPLTFKKVTSVEQISLPYDRKTQADVDPSLVYEVGTVRWAYENLARVAQISAVLSHVSGINPLNDIVFRRLEVGAIVGAYQVGEYEGRLTGNYVTPEPRATLDSLGVPAEWAAQKTHFALFKVVEEHFILDSVAAPFRGTKGGSRQFFLTDLLHRTLYTPAHFGELPAGETSPAPGPPPRGNAS